MSKTKLQKNFYTRWPKEMLALLASPMSAEEVATKCGRTVAAVYQKRQRMGLHTVEPQSVKVAPTSLKKDREVVDDAYWQRQYGTLNKKYQVLLKENNTVERLVAHICELAPKSYLPAPRIVHSRARGTGKAQSALLMLSDSHIGKKTLPTQTLAFGRYDFPTFLARLKYLEDSVISITENHVTTAVPELVIAMLGDMLDGTLTHSNEIGQIDPIFNQYYCGAHAVAQFLRNLAPYFPVIRIYDVVGNHTRFQGQKRMPTKNRYSNFDKFFYALVRELVRDIKNIKWTLDAQPYQVFDVQGFTFFELHGDTLRGGDKTLGVPNHSVGRLISTVTQMMNKYGRKAPNYYLSGHLHREIGLPHATGSFLVNGGFPGVDEFGLAEMFTPADPSQKFFFVHPQYGKTATYDISLKFAEVGPQAPYTIPAEFTMH
jgi:hypothetical protein